MNRYDLEMYITNYNKSKGIFTLIGVPEDLQVKLINDFTFLIDYKRKGFTVNINTNQGDKMTLRNYNFKPEKVKKPRIKRR